MSHLHLPHKPWGNLQTAPHKNAFDTCLSLKHKVKADLVGGSRLVKTLGVNAGAEAESNTRA